VSWVSSEGLSHYRSGCLGFAVHRTANADVVSARVEVLSNRETSASPLGVVSTVNLLGSALDVLQYSAGRGIFPDRTADAELGLPPIDYFGEPCLATDFLTYWDDLRQ
jgi:hypothetical protein